MDGIEALRHIVKNFGTPAIIVSSLTMKDAELTLKALEIGAFDFVTKPQDAISVHIREIGDDLIQKVRAAYENPLARLRMKKVKTASVPKEKKAYPVKRGAENVLAIGISTGGPNALAYLLPYIPGDFPAGILIVQHMPAGFTEMFAARLNALCKIEVREARDGDLILPGRALIAPGDWHLKVRGIMGNIITVLSKSSAVNGHRPSADVLFNSVAEEYGSNAAGLIMTGMGGDGAEGIGNIMEKGGFTIAQDEESCVVFGMPKVAIEKNYVKQIVSLEKMADFLINHFSGKEVEYGTA
jgi:two-component system chemotaxis response regulator CheB